ncbi:ankyrin [Lophium mytilinum]|uniref:Ankyrin n=1 Tax=Lophium mytilinum TaxID=390894 RepID=A0A6A6R075_9PEZI|nr:ankyrin [Lophium mytilinum]
MLYDWAKHRPVIEELYVAHNKPLDSVIKHMKDKYGFEARQPEEIFDNVNVAVFTAPSMSTYPTPMTHIMQVDATLRRLVIAVGHANVPDAQHLLESENGDDYINITNDSGRTLLYTAAGVDCAEMVKLLLDHGADSRASFEGESPLQHAVRLGVVDNVSVFLQHGPVHRDDMQAALKIAVCKSRAPEIVQALLDTFDNKHPLYDEERGSIDTTLPKFIRYLAQQAVDLRRDSWPDARYTWAKVLEILTSHEAWTESRRPVDDLFERFMAPMISDPTWYSSLNDHEISCLRFFLSKTSYENSNRLPEFPNSEDVSFIHYLLFHTPGSELADLLVDHANVANIHGTRILHTILDQCEHRKWKPSGRTPLQMVRRLLERGVDPDIRDGDGFTALTKLLERPRDLDVAKYLEALLTKADPTIRDAKWRAPLELAIRKFRDPIRSQLVETMFSTQRSAVFNPQIEMLKNPHYFPISAQWSDYSSNAFRTYMQMFAFTDCLDSVVRAAISVSTRKAVEDNTADDAPGDFSRQVTIVTDAIFTRKQYKLPDIPYSDGLFGMKLLEFAKSKLSPPWPPFPSSFPSGQVGNSHFPPQAYYYGPQQPINALMPSHIQYYRPYESPNDGASGTSYHLEKPS